LVKPDTCVFQITGMQGLYDGLVQDCTVERADFQTKHFVTIHGRKKLALKADGQGSAGLTETLGLLNFNEAETKKENLDALWAKHQSQAAQLAALVKFDRAEEIAEQAKKVKAASEPLNRTCGTNLTFTVDWSAAPDEMFKSARPEDGCLKIIESMTEMCRRWKVVRSAFAEKVSEVRCTYSDTRDPVMSLQGKTITMGNNDWAVSLPGAFDEWLKEAL
jgi:hypothetical protein